MLDGAPTYVYAAGAIALAAWAFRQAAFALTDLYKAAREAGYFWG